MPDRRLSRIDALTRRVDALTAPADSAWVADQLERSREYRAALRAKRPAEAMKALQGVAWRDHRGIK